MCVRLPARITAGFFGISLMSLPEKICNSVKNSRIWDSEPRAQRSCPIFRQKHSGSGNTNLTFRFQGSSLRITSASSEADCRRNSEDEKRRTPRLSQKPFHFECMTALNLPHGFSCRKACMNKALRQYCIQSEKP